MYVFMIGIQTREGARGIENILIKIFTSGCIAVTKQVKSFFGLLFEINTKNLRNSRAPDFF